MALPLDEQPGGAGAGAGAGAVPGGGPDGMAPGLKAIDLQLIHLLLIAACYYYGFRSMWLRQCAHARVVGLFTGIMAGALYATTISFLFSVDNPAVTAGVKVDIIKPFWQSFLTLGGCVVLPFYESFAARVAAILTNALMAQILGVARQLGWELFMEIRAVVVIGKVGMLLGGIAGVRGLVRLARSKQAEKMSKEYLLCLAVVVFAGILELSMAPGAASVYGLSMVAVVVSAGISSWFLNSEDLIRLMISNVLGIGCIFVSSRVMIVYAAVACLCYMSYKHANKRYQYLALATLCLGLVGVSLVSTESLREKKMFQPYGVVGFFMMLATVFVRLVAKRKFAAILSAALFFPLLYGIACLLDREQLAMREENMQMFRKASMAHLVSLVPISLGSFSTHLRGEKGWKIGYLLLSHTALFQLGYEGGNLWFKEKIWRLESVFRVAALLASLLGGFWKLPWETRYESLAVCVLLSEACLSPLSALTLCGVFWAARAIPLFVRRALLVVRGISSHGICHSRRLFLQPLDGTDADCTSKPPLATPSNPPCRDSSNRSTSSNGAASSSLDPDLHRGEECAPIAVIRN